MTDLSPDFVGRVERLSLRATSDNALMPLFEAISNSLHAVDDRFKAETSTKALVKVEVLRADLADEKSPVTGFVVEDNGIGLRPEAIQQYPDRPSLRLVEIEPGRRVPLWRCQGAQPNCQIGIRNARARSFSGAYRLGLFRPCSGCG